MTACILTSVFSFCHMPDEVIYLGDIIGILIVVSPLQNMLSNTSVI